MPLYARPTGGDWWRPGVLIWYAWLGSWIVFDCVFPYQARASWWAKLLPAVMPWDFSMTWPLTPWQTLTFSINSSIGSSVDDCDRFCCGTYSFRGQGLVSNSSLKLKNSFQNQTSNSRIMQWNSNSWCLQIQVKFKFKFKIWFHIQVKFCNFVTPQYKNSKKNVFGCRLVGAFFESTFKFKIRFQLVNESFQISNLHPTSQLWPKQALPLCVQLCGHEGEIFGYVSWKNNHPCFLYAVSLAQPGWWILRPTRRGARLEFERDPVSSRSRGQPQQRQKPPKKEESTAKRICKKQPQGSLSVFKCHGFVS